MSAGMGPSATRAKALDLNGDRACAAELTSLDDRGRAQLARGLFQDVSDLVFVFDPRDGRLKDINPAALNRIGQGGESLVGQPFWDLFSGLDAEGEAALRQAAGQAGSSWERSGLGLRRVEGEPIPVCVRVRTLSGPPEPIGLVLARARADQPMAEIAQELESLRRGKEAAEHANRTKSEFLAAYSHELRNPLSAMLGLVDLLMEGTACLAGTPSCLQELRAIQQNGRFLLDLTNELLDLAKFEVGKLRVERQPTAPAQVVEEVIAALRPRAEAKGLTLTVEYVTPIPATITTDALRLRQILINLVSNAIKFTMRGWIRVRIGLASQMDAAPEIFFEVTDTGVGISEADQARLFEPFFRAASSTVSSQEVGTGLGLAISRRMAELLGARLEARSVAGQGSTFTLTHPVSAEELRTLIRPHTHSSPELPAVVPASTRPTITGRILLAEDNEANRRVMTLRLHQVGAEVTAVADGRAVLDAVAAAQESKTPFDLILMDLQMPVLDGYEATRQLREQGFRQPIIALTAHARPEDREECLRFGCDDHISKPLNWNQLEGLLTKYLGARK